MKKILSVLLSLVIVLNACGIAYGDEEFAYDAFEDTVVESFEEFHEEDVTEYDDLEFEAVEDEESDHNESTVGISYEDNFYTEETMEWDEESIEPDLDEVAVEESFELDDNLEIAGDPAEITDSGTCGDNLSWTLDSEGTLTISGMGDMWQYNYTNGGLLQMRSPSVKNIVVKEGVTSIGNGAFSFCYYVTDVTLPNSVTKIGSRSFYCCYALTDISIPEEVTIIGEGAFYNCSNLTSIALPVNLMNIESELFGSCSSLAIITISKNVTSIGERAFYGCRNLNSITIPKSVTEIREYAFSECDKLTIYGYKESYAEEYAAENYIPFVSLGTSEDDENAYDLQYRSVNFSTPHGKKNIHKEIAIRFGFKLFDEDATQCGFNNELAQAGLALSAAIEQSYSECEQVFEIFNFGHMEHFESNEWEMYTPGICIGYRKVNYNGIDKYVVGVCARGTTTKGDILTDGASVVNGFRPAGDFAYKKLEEYITKNLPGVGNEDLILFITGHSYGAATANVLTQLVDLYKLADMSHTFSYVFAPPRHDTGITGSSFSNLFNIFNEDDIVCAIPRNKGHSGRILAYNYRKVDNSFDTKYISLTDGTPSYTSVMSEKWDDLSDYLPTGLIANLWKSEIFCIVGDYYAAFSHSPDTYMAFLLSSQPNDEVWKKFRIASVKCPVDVVVSTAEGKWLGSIINNVPSYAETTEIVFYIDGDDKYIYMPYGNNYNLKLTGTESGTMVYSIGESDALGNEGSKLASFENVTLTKGKEMITTSDPKAGESSIRLLVVDSTGKTTAEIQKDGKEIALGPVSGQQYTIGKGVSTYNVDGTATFSKPTSKNLTSFTIPKTVTIKEVTCKVTAIATAAFKNNKKLKKLTIGTNVTSIGSKVCSGCKALTTVKGGKSVTSIGAYAFYKCSVLKKFIIYSKVSKIGKRAFYSCSKLKKLTIKSKKLKKSSIGAGAFKKTPSDMTIKVPKKKLKTYMTILMAKGVSKSAKISV